MSSSRTSNGANRVAAVPPEVRDALEQGTRQCATLAECLALDLSRLLGATFPDLGRDAIEQVRTAGKLGILRRMVLIGELLQTRLGPEALAYSQAHPSDIVRGWACFMIGAQTGLTSEQRLAAIRPLADDAHFHSWPMTDTAPTGR